MRQRGADQCCCTAARPLRAPACRKSSRMAALLDDDSGSAKVSWNLDAIVASGVAGADLGVLYMHICNSVSGCFFFKKWWPSLCIRGTKCYRIGSWEVAIQVN